MKKTLSVFLSIIILTLSLSASFSAFAANADKYDWQKQQFNSQAATFNYSGDKCVKLIYDGKTKTYKVYYSAKLTKKGKAIFSVNDYTPLAIRGNYVYYADSAKGAIIRRRLDGKKAKALIKFRKNKYVIRFVLAGNRIVYKLTTITQDEKLEKSWLFFTNLKGKNKKFIAKNVKSEMYSYNNMLYFIKGKELMRYVFKTGELRRRYVGLDLTGAEIAGMENNIIYIAYIKGDLYNICNFYKADVEKQKYWKFQSVECDAPIHSAAIYECKPYIITGTGAGTAFAAVKGDKADFKSYKDKYEIGGDCLGFWKNNIVLDNYTLSEQPDRDGDFKFVKYVVMAKCK